MVDNIAERLDAVFHALSSHTRRSILDNLSNSDKTVGELAEPHDMSLAAISKHIDVLERSGLVTRLKQGRTTRCHFNAAQLEGATQILDYYRAFWRDRLDSLELFLSERTAPSDESN